MELYTPEIKTVEFNNGKTSTLIETLPTVSSVDVAKYLNIPPVRFSIVLHLGAVDTDKDYRTRMTRLLRDSVIRFAQDNFALVADGGTNAGVMRIMGQAYEELDATFPLVGVTVRQSVTYPGGPEPSEERFPLNWYHTHFVIVEADDFGMESQVLVGMARVAGLAGLAIIINGGGIVRTEAEMHARLGTPIIALKGTGRYADALAAAKPGDELLAAFDEGSSLTVFDIDRQRPEELYRIIRSLLYR